MSDHFTAALWSDRGKMGIKKRNAEGRSDGRRDGTQRAYLHVVREGHGIACSTSIIVNSQASPHIHVSHSRSHLQQLGKQIACLAHAFLHDAYVVYLFPTEHPSNMVPFVVIAFLSQDKQ